MKDREHKKTGTLCLGRHIGERVVIQTAEGEVEITIVQCKKDWVRLGIQAPPSVQVWREELIRTPRPVIKRVS